MGLRYVLDTNIVIYMLDGKLSRPLPRGIYHLSTISVVELLGFPKLDASEVVRIEASLVGIKLVPVDEKIARISAGLRRAGNVKVPDSIIAATAIDIGGILLTNDAKLLAINGVKSQSVSIQ